MVDFQQKREAVALSASLLRKSGTLGTKRKRIKVSLGGGLNRYHKHIGERERNQRAEIREANKHIHDIDLRKRLNDSEIKSNVESGLFVTNEKTLCTSIRRPKKGANEKQKKIQRSYEKNKVDATRSESANLNSIYEWYCTNIKQMNYRTFEKRMGQTKFRNDITKQFKGA